MDTRLIFRDFFVFLWEDGVQYVSRIIGFDVRIVRMVSRQIRKSLFNEESKRSENRAKHEGQLAINI